MHCAAVLLYDPGAEPGVGLNSLCEALATWGILWVPPCGAGIGLSDPCGSLATLRSMVPWYGMCTWWSWRVFSNRNGSVILSPLGSRCPTPRAAGIVPSRSVPHRRVLSLDWGQPTLFLGSG